MSLNKRVYQFPFTGKVSRRIDPKLQVAPNVTNSSNMYRARTGEWTKRGGYSALSSTVLDGSPNSIDTIRKLGKRASEKEGQDELVALTSNNLFVYSPLRSGWADMGVLSNANRIRDTTMATHSILPVPGGAFGQRLDSEVTDVAYSNGYFCVVTADSVTHVPSCSIIEEATGRLARGPTSAGNVFINGCRLPKVVATGGAFFVFSVEEGAGSSSLRVSITASSTLVFGTPTQLLAADLMGTSTGTPWYDVQVRGDNGQVVIAYRSAAATLKAAQINFGPVVSIGPVTVNAADWAHDAVGWLEHDYSSGQPRLATAWNDAGHGITGFTLNGSTLAQVGNSFLQASPGDVASITGWWTGSAYITLYEVRNAGDTRLTAVKLATNDGTGNRDYLTTGSLASKVFLQNGVYYVLASQPWDLQPTYMLCSASQTGGASPPSSYPAGLIARILRGAGVSNARTRNALTNAAAVGNGKFGLGVQQIYTFENVLSGPLIHRSPAVVALSMSGGLPQPIDYSNSCFFTGSMTRSYGGRSFQEMGFSIDPEKPTLSLQPGSVLTSGATYQYCYCYVYTDDEGRLWRSAPSVPASITTTAGNQIVRMTINNNFFIDRNGFMGVGTLQDVEVYRTQPNGTEFFRTYIGLTSFSVPVGQATTQTTFADDVASDASNLLGEPLYSQGGELIHSPPPPAISSCMQGSRMIVLDSEDNTKIWASQEIQPGQGIYFHPDLAQRIEADGPNIGCAVIEGRLIIFKRQAIYMLTGDWPDALGEGSLPTVQLIVSGFGTLDRESICIGVGGVYFKDPQKGVCFLSNALEVSQIGKDVQGLAIDTSDVAGASLCESHEQVRFTLAGNNGQFVYDYLEKQWYPWTGPSLSGGTATASVVANGIHYVGYTNGRVALYDATFTDPSAIFFCSVDLRLSLAGLEGVQRIYRINVYGVMNEQVVLQAFMAPDYLTLVPSQDVRQAPVEFSTSDRVIVAGSTNFDATIRPPAGMSRSTNLFLRLQWFTANSAGLRFSGISVEAGVDRNRGIRRLPARNIR